VALSTRFYAHHGSRIGFFASDGEAALVSLIINRRD
jgi:hypothetical protein